LGWFTLLCLFVVGVVIVVVVIVVTFAVVAVALQVVPLVIDGLLSFPFHFPMIEMLVGCQNSNKHFEGWCLLHVGCIESEISLLIVDNGHRYSYHRLLAYSHMMGRSHLT
jgi:phosphate starvation-inducible membrane PsiE